MAYERTRTDSPPGSALTVQEGRRIRNRIVRVVMGANFVAAVVLFLLLNLIVPTPDDEFGRSLVTFVVVMAVVFPAGGALGLLLFRPVERWIAVGRRPTPTEERFVIGGPRFVSLLAFLFWTATAAIVGIIEVLDGGPAIEGVRDAGALLAAGLTSGALTYLLVERRARPLVAVALAGHASATSRSLGLRPRLLLSWALGSGVPLFAIAVGELSVGPNDPRVSPEAAMFLAGTGIVVGAVMTVAAVRSVADPIDGVRRALAAVEGGELMVRVAVDDGGEIGRLQSGVNQMVEGLRERQRLADLFGRHVGVEVARRAVESGVRLGGERRDASALFVDLRDSTGLAARAPAEDVVALLNRFFGEVVDVVTSEGGWVNKFEGDGAMCIFGAPAQQPDHAARALRAARRLRGCLVEADLRAAVGVSSGGVVAGNVGAEERFEYTVIGDAVNEAARLTEAAKAHAGALLASGATIERAGEEAGNWEFAAELQVRGRPEVTVAYAPCR